MLVNGIEVFGVIYKITNKINNKVYVGRTIYGFDLRYGKNWWEKSHSKKLKNSIDKYGVENFEVCKILDIAYSNKELNDKEKYYIEKYKSYDKKYGYNILKGGSPTDFELYRYNMSKAVKNSETHIKKTSTKEFSEKMSKNMKYRMENTNLKQLISEGQKKSWNTIERKNNHKKILQERWADKEFKEKVGNSIKKAWQNEEVRKKIVDGMKKKYYLKNIETGEVIEFLGREQLAESINKSVSYVKVRLNNDKLHEKKYIIYNDNYNKI